MKYIDAEKLIAEIKRQKRNLVVLSNTEQVCVRRDCAIQNGVYSYILSVITSLQQEQPEADLEKEYERFVTSDPVYSKLTNGIVGKAIARHFYELGLNARK